MKKEIIYQLSEDLKPIAYEVLKESPKGELLVKGKDGIVEALMWHEAISLRDIISEIAEFDLIKRIELLNSFKKDKKVNFINLRKLTTVDDVPLELAMRFELLSRDGDISIIHGRYYLANMTEDPSDLFNSYRLTNMELHTLSGVFEDGRVITISYLFDLKEYNKKPLSYISYKFLEFATELAVSEITIPTKNDKGVSFVYKSITQGDTMDLCSIRDNVLYLDDILSEIYQYSKQNH